MSQSNNEYRYSRVKDDLESLTILVGLIVSLLLLILGIFSQLTIINIIIGSFGTMLYFIPSIVAYNRNRHSREIEHIFITNLLFGWTCAGWLIDLMWANQI